MKRNIVIVTHKNLTHPDDELVVYLNDKKYTNVLHICHSFYEVPNRKSYYLWYKNGKIYREKSLFDFKQFSEPVVYLKEIVYSFFWVLTSGIIWETYIGMDGLCVYVGNILRKIGKVKKTVYWAIDFVPANRFPSGLANKIYTYINTYGYKQSDEMWDLSPRMAEAREKYLGLRRSDYRKLKVVQYGMWIEKIKKISFAKCEQHTVVFLGRLLENQGAQLVIKAMPKILKKDSKFLFKIIGSGPYFDALVKLAKKEKVYAHCRFLGRIESHREIEDEIAKSALAVAPYISSLDKWTYYADPGKVKTYLACGIPVLLTDLPWNAREIEKVHCGKIITENIDTLAKEICNFLHKEKNQRYRSNARKYAKNFDYATIFTALNI